MSVIGTSVNCASIERLNRANPAFLLDSSSNLAKIFSLRLASSAAEETMVPVPPEKRKRVDRCAAAAAVDETTCCAMSHVRSDRCPGR